LDDNIDKDQCLLYINFLLL